MEEHVKDRISAYLDKALPGSETALVESHLASCPSCRAELEETRRVSALVAGLPKRPLPAGFLERLAQRRAAGESPESLSAWLPAPARLAAFAAAGLAVAFVVHRQRNSGMDYKTAMLESGNRISLKGMAEPPPPAAPEPAEAKPEAAGADKLATRSAAFDNETQQQFLQKERKRMGIREIVPAQAAPASALGRRDEPFDRPLNKKEAMSVIRQMTDDIARANLYKQMKSNPVVPLGGGSSPQLLSEQDRSRPLQAEEHAPPARAADGAGSVAMVAGSGGKLLDTSSPIAAKAGAPRTVATAPAKRMRRVGIPFTASWKGASAGVRGPTGTSVASDADWAALWRRIDPKSPAPAVDFGRNTALAVFGGQGHAAVTIRSVQPLGGRLVVRWDHLDSGLGAPVFPYHIVLVPRTDLPVSFELQP